jgi:mycothiol synthase
MTIALHEARTDAELEAWLGVRVAVVPNERAGTVAEMRAAQESSARVYLLATLDGETVGAGMAGQSEMAGRASLLPRVVPSARRRGVGTALLRALAAHVESLGFDEAGTRAEEPGAVAFAERFGFREVNREVEQVRTVGDEPWPRSPEGVEIVSVAERPELWTAVYETVGSQAFQDLALDTPLDVSPEQWEREWLNWPEATFVALAGGEPVGTAGLMRDDDRADRAENALTAVRRDWRGRGVASALKRAALACAAEHGIREVYTWTQRGNADMRRLNEHLGYSTRTESIMLRAPLPLP